MVGNIMGEVGEGLLMLEANALVQVNGHLVAAPHANLGLGSAPLLKFVEGGEEKGTAVSLPPFPLYDSNWLNRIPLQPSKTDGLLIFEQKEDVSRVI